MRKLFKKYEVDSDNFASFQKELDSPKSQQNEFRELIDEIHNLSNKRSFTKIKPISKNDFESIIRNIRTNSEMKILKGQNEYVKVSEFLTTQKNEILEVCDKLFLYSDLLTVNESKLLSQIYNLKLLNKWNGVEPHQYFSRFAIELKTYLDDCYKLHLVSIKLSNYVRRKMNQKEYNDLINEKYEVE